MRGKRGVPAAMLILQLLALLLPVPADAATEWGACSGAATACETAATASTGMPAAVPATDPRVGAGSWRHSDGTAGPHTAADGDTPFARRRLRDAARAAASTAEHASTHGLLRFHCCGRDGAPPRAPPHPGIR